MNIKPLVIEIVFLCSLVSNLAKNLHKTKLPNFFLLK